MWVTGPDFMLEVAGRVGDNAYKFRRVWHHGPWYLIQESPDSVQHCSRECTMAVTVEARVRWSKGLGPT